MIKIIVVICILLLTMFLSYWIGKNEGYINGFKSGAETISVELQRKLGVPEDKIVHIYYEEK